MLLNEFLKEHRKVEEQKNTISELKSILAQERKDVQVLTARVEEQAAHLQKVSEHLALSKAVPQLGAASHRTQLSRGAD